MTRLGGLLLGVLLLLPVAAAAGVASGAFVVEGQIRFPEGADSSLDAALLFQGDASSVPAFDGAFRRLTIHAFEMSGASAAAVEVLAPERSSVVNVTSAQVHLVGAREGYLGVYPSPAGRTSFVASEPLNVSERDRTEVTTAIGPGLRERPLETREYYRQVVSGPHLYSETAGVLAYEGPGWIKVFGLDLEVQGVEGTQTFTTGSFSQGPPGARSLHLRWVVLEFEAGRVEVAADAPWTLAARAMDAQWDGVARFDPAEGEMRDAASRYLPTDAPAHVEGAFLARLEPEAIGRMRVALEGELASTSLRAQSLPMSVRLSNDGTGSALLFALGVALAAAGAGFTGGWYAAWRRRPPAPAPAVVPAGPFTAEDCCDAGAKAASEEDWAAAAKWFGRAHALAPTSARICGDLAFSLSQIGDADAALRMYAEASRMSEDGEADFNAALAALHADRPLEDVETWLERALERSPALVMPLESDSDFHVLKGRPRYEEAVRQAWARLGARS